jgi:hypothetical protein
MNQSVYIEQEDELVEVELQSEDFAIDETAIDRTLCGMGRLILQYGTIEAEVKMRVGRLSSELERVRALLDGEVRAEFTRNSEKATEARVAHSITLNEDYQNYVKALNQAERDQAMMRWAMTALIHKSECLRAFAFRENQSMKADTRHGG